MYIIQYHTPGQRSLNFDLFQLLSHTNHHLNQHPQVTLPQLWLRHPHCTVKIQLVHRGPDPESLLDREMATKPQLSASPLPPSGTGQKLHRTFACFWRAHLLSFHLDNWCGCICPVFANQDSSTFSRWALTLHRQPEKGCTPLPSESTPKQLAGCVTPGTCSYQGLDSPTQQKNMNQTSV